MKCPSCGSEVQPSHRHCIECGERLSGPSLSPHAELVLSGLREQLSGMRESLETISFPAASEQILAAARAAEGRHRTGEAVEQLDYRLVVVAGRRAGAVFDVGRIITFGRAAHCEVPLNDIAVSREHCRIVFHPERRVFLLQDLKSQNGVTLNGERTPGAELSSGDRIGVGEAVMVFVRGDVPAELRADLEARGIAVAHAELGSAAPTADELPPRPVADEPGAAEAATEDPAAEPAAGRSHSWDPPDLHPERNDTAPDLPPAPVAASAGFVVPAPPAGVGAGWPTTEELTAAVTGADAEPAGANVAEAEVWTSAPTARAPSVPAPPGPPGSSIAEAAADATIQQIDLPAELLAAAVGARDASRAEPLDLEATADDDSDEELLAALATTGSAAAAPVARLGALAAAGSRESSPEDDAFDEQETLQFEAAVYGRRTPTGEQPTEMLPAVSEGGVSRAPTEQLGETPEDLEHVRTRPMDASDLGLALAAPPAPHPVPRTEVAGADFPTPDLFSLSSGGSPSPGLDLPAHPVAAGSPAVGTEGRAAPSPQAIEPLGVTPLATAPVIERRTASPGAATNPLGRRAGGPRQRRPTLVPRGARIAVDTGPSKQRGGGGLSWVTWLLLGLLVAAAGGAFGYLISR